MSDIQIDLFPERTPPIPPVDFRGLLTEDIEGLVDHMLAQVPEDRRDEVHGLRSLASAMRPAHYDFERGVWEPGSPMVESLRTHAPELLRTLFDDYTQRYWREAWVDGATNQELQVINAYLDKLRVDLDLTDVVKAPKPNLLRRILGKISLGS